MDLETAELQTERSSSFSRLSATGSSKWRSLSIPRSQIDNVSENESVSEAGDIGDRALHRLSLSRRSLSSLDHGIVFPEPSEPSDVSIPSGEESNEVTEVHWLKEYSASLLSLAVFGILGVLARYFLKELFGPKVIGATSNTSFVYPDLFSNMVGSFLMGWLGVVYKPDIIKVSDELAIGLTTGFLGSLTTFSGWNQSMLDLSVQGRWGFAVLDILIGLVVAAISIFFGVWTAKMFKGFHRRPKTGSGSSKNVKFSACMSNRSKCLLTFMVIFLLILCLLWGLFIGLEVRDFKSGSSEAELYLGCLIGPFGVWMRWFLARLNGRGLGKSGMLKWLPFGTLAANVSAACIMAALATLKKVVKTRICDTVASGIQLGLLGCLSTVSTFMAEFHAMGKSSKSWHAFAYAAITLTVSFLLGTLIYSVPVWVGNYG